MEWIAEGWWWVQMALVGGHCLFAPEVDSRCLAFCQRHWARARPVLVWFAHQEELLDPRERWTLLIAPPDSYEIDLGEVRRRYRQLRDAPRVRDCPYALSRDQIYAALGFNAAFQSFLEERIALFPQPRLTQVRRENQHLYAIWDQVRTATCRSCPRYACGPFTDLLLDSQDESNYDFYHIATRRRALQQLERLVGPENYWRGWLPPPVPLWHFERVQR